MEKKGKPSRLLKGKTTESLKKEHTFGEACRALDWLGEDYQRLFEAAKDKDTKTLAALLVCAYDGVPAGAVGDALKLKDLPMALLALHKKYVIQTYGLAVQETLPKESLKRAEPEQEPTRGAFEDHTEAQADDTLKLVDEIMYGGYTNDQIEYLLTCIEDGVEPQIVREIAHKDYPAEIMRKLKDIKVRRNRNLKAQALDGKKGGATHG